MSTLVLMSIVLFALMTYVGKWQGVRAFIAFFLNFGALIVLLFFLVNPDVPIILVTALLVVVVGVINLFFINGVHEKTKIAFASTLLTALLIFGWITWLNGMGSIQGFGEEEMDELTIFSLHVGLDFVKIGAAVIVMSTIGAIMDVAISIVTALYELAKYDRAVTRRELFASGIRIGRDILGTDTNTLFFAFFGGYLALLLWFKDLSYTFGEMINSKVFSAEMVTIFSAGMAIALVIPITTILTVWRVKKSDLSS